jgi:integrase
MRYGERKQELRGNKWSSSLNPELYDRNPALTSREARALRSHVHEHHPAKSALHDRIRRLVEPLGDLLNHTKLRRRVRPFLVLYLLREMSRRGRSFWGWTMEEWIETINKHPAQQQHLIAAAYLLCGFAELDAVGWRHPLYVKFAQKVFGQNCVDGVLDRVRTLLVEWGYSGRATMRHIPRTVCEALLANRSPCLEDLTIEVLKTVEENRNQNKKRKEGTGSRPSVWLVAVSRVLTRLGVIREPLSSIRKIPAWKTEKSELAGNVSTEWANLCKFWFDTSTLCFNSRRRSYYFLLNIGRWVGHEHPEATSPAQWTRGLAADCVAMVSRMRSGDWTEATKSVRNLGQPLAANTKAASLSIVRRFFRDLQEWETIPRRFDPLRTFATPKTIVAQIGPNPRVIADDVWAKLLWAGLNFTADDLPRMGGYGRRVRRRTWHRFELVRAFVVTWLFAGLRINEITRLRLGCVRWQNVDVPIPGTQQTLPRDAVCFLEVPVNKTGRAFTKPVDRLVGESIGAWEKVRPLQSRLTDTKTGELVDFLFLEEMRRVSLRYLDSSIIPMLCRKAGIPINDVRGRITSHRARSTIASQLFNAKEPMTLFELQEWLGHSSPDATQHYAKITPTKLAKSYADAGYFGRNLRTIEVLIDQEAVKSGGAAHEAWKFYDLGHGYCSYDFFEQCPHRMACAKCSFYRPKDSTKTQILEAKTNLLRLRQDIPLAEAELSAVEEGLTAYEQLLAKLADVPTPEGPTPRQLGRQHLVHLQVGEQPTRSEHR